MVTPIELKERLRGVLVFAPTPFVEGGLELDLAGFRRNMEFLAAGGIDLVAVAGFVGEFSALTAAEYRDVIRTAREALGPDRIIVVGVGYGSELAAQYAADAEANGADCAMLLPPYLVEPTEDGMVAHVQRVASSTRLGIMVHSMPGFAFSPRLIERLADISGVVSYKDELGDIRGFAEIVDRVGYRLAYVNGRAELMMGYYASAGAGVLASAIANFDPALALAAFDAASALDFPRLRQVLRPRATPWYRLRERNRGYLISVSKASMNLVGLAGGVVRPPLSGLQEAVRSELRALMEDIGYLKGAEA
jgi:5-dehydro-4-deoxyglucarate dehydratase